MEYEVFEPDLDEYYDQACSAAYARMFNEGRDYSAYVSEDSFPSICPVSDC